MFGCPWGFLGLPFDPMGGRPMREYVVVPAAWLEGDNDEELRAWAGKSRPLRAQSAAQVQAAASEEEASLQAEHLAPMPVR
jgi:hypothetical protein